MSAGAAPSSGKRDPLRNLTLSFGNRPVCRPPCRCEFRGSSDRPPHPIIARVTDPARIEAFISRWAIASGSERANYQLFVTELCELLGTPKPDPARDDTRDNAYVFERRVQFAHGDGSHSLGFID